MAATTTAHNPSEISNIAISASPVLRRRGASGAERSDVARPCRDRRSTGYLRSEAVSLSNGSSLCGSRRACVLTRSSPMLRIFGQPNVMTTSKIRPFRIVVE